MSLKDLVNHPLFQLSSYLIGVLGLILAVYYYKRGKLKKQLAYFKNDVKLIGHQLKEVSKLSVYYENMQVTSLTVSELYIYNSGNVMIDSNDVVPLSKILIKCKGDGKILEQSIEFYSDPTNNWKSEIIEDKVAVSFDYVRPLGGCKIKIAHTADNLILTGKLKESEIINQRIFGTTTPKDERKNFIGFITITMITFILGITYSRGWFVGSILGVLATIKIIKQWRDSIKMADKNSIFQQFVR